MESLSYNLKTAKTNKYAIGAFNIFNYQSANAVVAAAKKLIKPIIIQTSTSTVKKYGADKLIRIINAARYEASVPIIVHLDHCKDMDLAKDCIYAGWDSIMFDASHLTFEENVRLTSEIVAIAHSKAVEVEGELGTIFGVEDDISSDVQINAQFEESIEFINRTGIDAYAPAIGTAHGVYKGVPNIDFDIVDKLSKKTDCPIVIHGGTGLTDDDFRKLVRNGASKINVSTALKHAFLEGCKNVINNNNEKIDPLVIDEIITNEIYKIVMRHMQVFTATE